MTLKGMRPLRWYSGRFLNSSLIVSDVKGRFTARLPYMLVSTPAALCSMLYGRRKAIEVSSM